jgi:hypothetical protein
VEKWKMRREKVEKGKRRRGEGKGKAGHAS